MNRRQFLGSAGLGAAAVLSGGSSSMVHPRAKSLRLGGPVFVESSDPAVLAKAHRDLGYRAAYAPNAMAITEKERIAAWVSEMARHDVVTAEVGAWRNMLDPDSSKRRETLMWVGERLALAEALGARTCVDIAGSFNPTSWSGAHPRNFSREFFDATVENCRTVIDLVKPQRTTFSIEMMPWSWPSSPDESLALIKAVDRKAFAAHLDVCNLMNSPARIYDNASVIRECFKKLGPRIVSCHAKDVNWGPGYQMNVLEVIPGKGVLDYQTYCASYPGCRWTPHSCSNTCAARTGTPKAGSIFNAWRSPSECRSNRKGICAEPVRDSQDSGRPLRAGSYRQRRE